MKKVILTIFLYVCLVWQIEAQDKPVVPGYMGLKFSMQYQLGINPQWMNLHESYLPYFTNNFQAGYVVSRKHEVGVQYFAVTMGVGRNIILCNRMLLTIEGDLNFPLSTLARAIPSSHVIPSIDIVQYNSPDANFKRLNALDAMLANIIQIKIGIGALLF